MFRFCVRPNMGDSLLVMTSLAEKEGLKGKVQTIYFDPPYGIKFGSNWQVSTRKRDVKDGKVEDATRQPEQIRAFRDTWKLGIHSYLAYLRDRLTAARELLTETGAIFVQIGDQNMHLVRCVLDEVFGSENQVATITFQKTGSTDQSLVPQTIDYLLLYAKNKEIVKYRQLYQERTRGSLALERYDQVFQTDGALRRLTSEEAESGEVTDGIRAQLTSLTSARPLGAGDLRQFRLDGVLYTPGSGTFKTDERGMTRLVAAGRAVPAGKTLRYVRLVSDFPVVPIHDRWEAVQLGTGLMYVVQTSAKVIERCLLMTTDPGDLVLDPTCGSGTTAYVAEQWGRRWITIDTSRVALALARTRLMAGRFPYYHLADHYPDIKPTDTDETIRAILKHNKGGPTSGGAGVPPASGGAGLQPAAQQTGGAGVPPASGDIRKGFIYRRVPHITLKSIANNPDIREGMTRDEIDAAIARHADTEQLFDKPYEDARRVRVSGPFTVESLSPHRILAPDADPTRSAAVDSSRAATIDPSRGAAPEPSPGREPRDRGPLSPKPPKGATQTPHNGESLHGNFEHMIIQHLRSAGVQNTRKSERLKFDSLEPRAGLWIHAAGEYTDNDGKTRRVAISIGPEHGTVGPDQVKEAAKEAVQGVGYDLLLVCGFAFDPHVSEESKRYGKLTVLPTRMNPDLAMGDELLKKTGAGNLFMVFGEPDVEIRRVKPDKSGNGKATRSATEQIEVEIRGVDVYDPTTGQIRSSSTDDIACWFIDTEYDGESFMVRHAYFTGADEPYEKLKRALRAEIDEAAWSSLYSTVSRPFDVPESGKIAVKVINHYGDEVLKVFQVK